MRRAASGALILLLLATVPAAARPVRLAYLFSDGNIPGTVKAYQALLEERPDLRGQLTLTFLTESMFDDTKADDLTAANVLVLDMMNQQLLERFNAKHRVDTIASVKRGGTVLAVGEGLLPKQHYIDEGAIVDERAGAFWGNSGFANQLALMKYALTRAGVSGLTIPEPQPSLDFGYYYPDGTGGRVFRTWQDFDAWREAHGKSRPGAPRVAIGFFKATYYGGDTGLLDQVIAEVERQGAEAVPVFGYPGAVASRMLLRDGEGHPRADVMLGFFFSFADPESSKLLEQVDIPIINLVALYGRTEKEWRESSSGMSLFEGTFQMAVPELAGTIAPTIVGSKEKIRDPATGLTVVVTRPIVSRVHTAVERALRYAVLRRKPNAQKHVALMYYNYPPGKANVGASYLNVAESLTNVLQRLAKEGYDLGDADLSARQVLHDITTKARNVGGYAPGELQEMITQGSVLRVAAAEYNRWLEDYAQSLRARIVKDWGAPEKTRLMASSDGGRSMFVIPVIRYGNVALLPQPSREGSRATPPVCRDLCVAAQRVQGRRGRARRHARHPRMA
jgi:cobaltochelatase CobN